MSKTVKNLIKQMYRQFEEKQYAAAQHTADRLEAELISRDDDDQVRWAAFYDVRFKSFLATGNREQALTIARKVSEKINAWYAEVRPLRYETYLLLVEDALSKEADEEAIEAAVDYINEAVELVTFLAGEKERYLKSQRPYFELRAAIHVRAMREVTSYRKQKLYDVMRALQEAEEQCAIILDENVKEALKSELYKKYKNGEALFDWMRAPAGETWRQSLQRFEEAVKDLYQDVKVPFMQVPVTQKEKPSVHDIEAFEARMNMPLPKELSKLYAEFGRIWIHISREDNFISGEDDFFQIISLDTLQRQSDRSSSRTPEDFIGLATMISMRGEGEESYLKSDLEPEIYAELNARYKVFGCFEGNGVEEFDQMFCFFDQEGRFGEQIYIHDYYDGWWDDLYQKNKTTYPSFDALFSRWIDRALSRLIEEKSS